MNLNKEEIQYYHRHLILPHIGKTGQQALKKAKVLVIGAGGLGCPILMYLSGAGVGRIGIVDPDKVAVSNLHRQVLYGFSQVGEFKAEAAVNRLKDLNPNIVLKAYTQRLSPENAVDLISQYDVIVDATDNFPTRYLINDFCVYLDKPFVSGSIDRFQGQLSVLNFTDNQGNKCPTYRCLFPNPPAPEIAPDCSQNGVIGVLPGIIGNLQANEAIKMICGVGEVLSGKVLMFDALSNQTMLFSIQRNEQAVQQALQNATDFESFDYESFCSSSQQKINEISAVDLHKKLQNNEKIQLIDVRSIPEFQEELPNAVRIPLNILQANIHNISKNDSQVVFYCDHGINSVRAIRMLPNHHKLKNVFNLTGGLAAWLKEEKSRTMNAKNYFIQGAIDPVFIGEQIAKHSSKHDIGAHSIFLGQVRADEKVGKQVAGIEYSAYEDMANQAFSKIREEAFEQWPLNCLHIYHSTGLVKTGELSLFVFCSSGHRKESIKAMEQIVEGIKHKVPIWKKEIMEDKSMHWVQE